MLSYLHTARHDRGVCHYAKRDRLTLFTGDENFDLAALDEMDDFSSDFLSADDIRDVLSQANTEYTCLHPPT